MKNVLLYFLLVIVAGELITIYIINKPKPVVKILSNHVVGSPIPTASPSLTPFPSPLPTTKPTPKPTKTPIPQPVFSSQEINGFIDKYAGIYGVDPNVLRHMALCESGFNPMAKKLSYQGLFQFGPATWSNLRIQMNENPNTDLRLNAMEAVKTTAYAIKNGKFSLWPNCKP